MERNEVLELLRRLSSLREEIADIERILATLGVTTGILNEERINQTIGALREIERDRVFHALARINFRDEYYRFIRAIDGDTIVVAPPPALQEWMSDLHVRLYGLETPELWQQYGAEYRTHLEELCAIDANGHLMIIWERERLGTNYEGFPLATFERGVGHVFYKGEDNRFVYINGLMHVLKHSSLARGGKSLLRGRRHLQLPNRLAWSGSCPSWPTHGENSSATLRAILEIGPPACLLTYSQVPSLDPRDPAFEEKILSAMRENWRFGCPLEDQMRLDNDALRTQVLRQHVSPFDVPLTYASAWVASFGGNADPISDL
jgi:hypothetical protein